MQDRRTDEQREKDRRCAESRAEEQRIFRMDRAEDAATAKRAQAALDRIVACFPDAAPLVDEARTEIRCIKSTWPVFEAWPVRL